MPRSTTAVRKREQKERAPAAPRGEARRELIVEAALAVIGRVGPDALTHRLVAAEAGLPLAATTYWFASKEELIVEAFARVARRDVAGLERMTEQAASWTRATAPRRLARWTRSLLTDERAGTVVCVGLWIEAARRPELQPLAEEWNIANDRFFVGVLRTLGSARPEDDGHLLAAAFDGLMMEQLTRGRPRSEADLTALYDRLIGAFVG